MTLFYYISNIKQEKMRDHIKELLEMERDCNLFQQMKRKRDSPFLSTLLRKQPFKKCGLCVSPHEHIVSYPCIFSVDWVAARFFNRSNHTA